MQRSTVKKTCLFPPSRPFSHLLPCHHVFFSTHSFHFFLIFSSLATKKKTRSPLPFLSKSNTPTISPVLCHSLSFCLFLFLSGRGGDRHCVTVVLLCLGEGESRPAFTLGSIAAWVSSKAAIQPAQSLPTGNRPTKEKGAARLLCSVPSEAALRPPPPINNTALPQHKKRKGVGGLVCPCELLLPSLLYFSFWLPPPRFTSPLSAQVLTESEKHFAEWDFTHPIKGVRCVVGVDVEVPRSVLS